MNPRFKVPDKMPLPRYWPSGLARVSRYFQFMEQGAMVILQSSLVVFRFDFFLQYKRKPVWVLSEVLCTGSRLPF